MLTQQFCSQLQNQQNNQPTNNHHHHQQQQRQNSGTSQRTLMKVVKLQPVKQAQSHLQFVLFIECLQFF